MAKELKYDGSDKELLELGLISEEGTVLDRNKFNLYMKEVAQREEYKKNQEMIDAGIVDESGRVLDADKLREYQANMLDKKLAEQDKLSGQPKAGLFRRAIQKMHAKFSNNKTMQMPQNDNTR